MNDITNCKKNKHHTIFSTLNNSVIEYEPDFINYVNKVINLNKDMVFSKIIEYVCDLILDEKEACILWEKIIEHNYLMSKLLGWNVSIKTAACDYIIKNNIKQNVPKLINKTHFEDLLKAVKDDRKTGLYNSEYFKERLNIELNRSKRNNNPFSIIFIDIDNFKLINDELGHIEADKILIHIAQIIKNTIRLEDSIARFGGDEFVLLLVQTEKSDAGLAARRLYHALNTNPYINNEKEIIINVSMGLASYPADGESTDELMKKADSALYDAKRNGKNQILPYINETCNKNKPENIKYNNKKIFINIKNNNKKYPAHIKNITKNGALLDIPHIVPLMQGIYLMGEIEEENFKKIKFSGKIVYAKQHENGFFASVKFENKNIIPDLKK